MKSGTILFFVWGVCFSEVASYRPYPGHGYRQGTYQQHPEWSNNQNYPQNPGLAFPARQPHANYGASQSVVNYMQASPETNYQQEATRTYPETQEEPIYDKRPREVILQQQFPEHVEQSQSDVIYVESASPPQTYAEVPRPYTPSLDIRHESCGGVSQTSQWQPPPPPPNPVFQGDSYPSQIPRHWVPQNSNPYPPSNDQEPHPRPASYPQWQSTGQQIKSHYGNTYNGQNKAPLQYTSHAEAQASAVSANNFQEIHENQNEQLQVNVPKVHNIVVVDDGSADNAQYLQSSDTDFQEKNLNKRQENLNKKTDPNPSELDNVKNANTNSREFNQNIEFLPQSGPNFLKETHTDAVPANERYVDNNSYQKHDSIKTNSEIIPKESHVARPVVHNYRLIPVFKLTPPHENKVFEQNIAPAQSPPVWNNNFNDHLGQPADPQATQTDVILEAKDSNDKKYENKEDINKYNEPLNPLKDESIHKYHEALVSHLAKQTNKINLSQPKINAAEYNSNHNPNFDSFPKNKENGYSNNQIIRNTVTPDQYTAKPDYYAITTDAPNPSDELNTTSLPYQNQNQAKTPDEIDISSKLASPKTLNNVYLENKDQTKVSMEESNYDNNSNIPNNPEDANLSKIEYNIDVKNNLTSEIEKKTYSENITVSDTATNTVEMELNSTDTQNYETYSDDDDNTLVGSTTASSTAIDDITLLYLDEKENTQKEDFSIYIDTINNDYNEESEQPEKPENIDLDEEAASDNESSGKEVADFPQHLSRATFWIRPDEGYWDDFYSENETEQYDDIYMCNVKFSDLIIERTSKFYMHKNGTFVEETEEIIWEHRDDAVPKEIKTTKTMRNPVSKNRHKKKQSDALEAPKCSRQPKA